MIGEKDIRGLMSEHFPKVKIESISGGRHWKVRLLNGDRRHSVSFPRTPSCHRAMKNKLSQLRNILR